MSDETTPAPGAGAPEPGAHGGDPQPPAAPSLWAGERRRERPDPRTRPRDPAGTQPRHDPSSLLPASRERLAYPSGATVDGTAEELGADRGELPAGAPPAPATAPARGGDGDGALAPAALREPPHAARFQFITGALIAVAAAGLVVLAVALFAGGGGDRTITISGPRWSAWAPAASGGDGATQIADHVAREYRLSDGRQLVAVTGGPMEVAGLPLTVALRQTPAQGGNIQLLAGKGVLYRMCGLGEKCAISEGKPSTQRHLLLRREAFEMALYSFRYLEGVTQVVVFLPPRKGQDPTQALFFRRADVTRELDRPLTATLSAKTPTVSTVTRSPDAALVNTVTTQALFQFSLTQANQDARAFLVLDPLVTK